jgi:hypothetical protein
MKKKDAVDSKDITLMEIEPGTRYAFSINPYLSNKLKKHLHLLNAINLRESQSRWVLQAIRERLDNESMDDILEKEVRVNITIDTPTRKALDHRIELCKKCRTSFSKKQWIVEAVAEKLDRDEKKLREKLKSKLEN